MTTPSDCVGPEFTLDDRGVLSTKAARPAAWPGDTSAMTQSNGLLTDSDSGLWVPQTTVLPTTAGSARARTDSSAVDLPLGTGVAFTPAVTALAIPNPSAVQQARFRVQVEWEITYTVQWGSWIELWGGWRDPAGDGIVADTRLASGRPEARNRSGDVITWHKAVNRVFTVYVAPGATMTPVDVQWKGYVPDQGTSGYVPRVKFWRFTQSVVGVLLYPVSIA